MGIVRPVLRRMLCSRWRKGAQGVRDRYVCGISYWWTGRGEPGIVSSAIGGSNGDSA